MPALELDGVRKEYAEGDTTVVALDGIDLRVDGGELVALVGPSGSGKSTALAIAGALLTPTAGEVTVGGTALSALRRRQRTAFRRRNVGFVFQAVNLVPFLTARENLLVMMGRDAGAKARATALLTELGLGERCDALAGRLSGGERQRVAIARALANDPALLLVDEPTSALDTERGHQVMRLLRAAVDRRGTAAVVVTHDPRMVDACHRAVTLRDGRIAVPGRTPDAPPDGPQAADGATVPASSAAPWGRTGSA